MFKNFAEKFKWPIAVPCLPLVLIASLSAMPFIVSYSFQFSMPLTCLLVIPVLLILFKSLKNIKRDTAISVITLFSALYATHVYETHISIHNPYPRSYIKIQGVIENVHYYDTSLNWSAQENRKVTVALSKIYKDGNWQNCSGKIHLRDPDNLLKYGDNITVEGALFRYENKSSKLFSYDTYLKSQKITHWMRMDNILKISPPEGYRYLLKKSFELRDYLIGRAGKGLKNEKDRKLLASMFFGYKGLLAADEKEVFKRSGTVHLFAVSGLHIGIAAFFIISFLKLCRLHIKVQTISLVSILGLYVLMTGSPASAVRAFVMISVWSIAKGFMLPSNGLNNIAFSALLLIIANPLNLISAGFYYTFIITTFLVITYLKSLELFQDLMEKKMWLGKAGWSSEWKLKFFLLFSCSLCASIATFGLNLLINERVIPFALFTNMAASTLAWFSFLISILSISGLSIFYSLQEMTLSLIRFTAESGEFSWYASASLLLVVIFYIIIFVIPLMVQEQRRKWLIYSTMVLMIFLGWPQNENSIDIAVPSSSNICTIKIKNEGRNYLINCSSSEIVRGFFHENIDTLILPDIRADHIRQLDTLLKNSNIREIIIFRKPTANFRKVLEENNKLHLVKIHKDHHLITSFSESKDEYNIELLDVNPGQYSLHLALKRKAHGKSFFELSRGHYQKKITFMYSNKGYREKISF